MSIKERIRQRRAQMLVHSCLYYELNENIVDDHTWQKWADELEVLQRENGPGKFPIDSGTPGKNFEILVPAPENKKLKKRV